MNNNIFWLRGGFILWVIIGLLFSIDIEHKIDQLSGHCDTLANAYQNLQYEVDVISERTR